MGIKVSYSCPESQPTIQRLNDDPSDSSAIAQYRNPLESLQVVRS